MKITFMSNYMNHHQLPFCEELYRQLGEEFTFIQTRPMETERLAMGWNSQDAEAPFVLKLYEQREQCMELINDSDILVAGWSQEEELVQARLLQHKPVIRISERIYREGQWKVISPRGLVAKYKEHLRFKKYPVCMLCAGAYVASDFHLIGAYKNKMFKWGYFPKLRHYNFEELMQKKFSDGKVHIVWAGRFIPLKHPEYMVTLGMKLKNSSQEGSPSFHIHMIGGGDMLEDIKRAVRENELESSFSFYGYQSPEQVRDIMEQCHIHIFTSNQLEGWGAVLNEAMNSGCVPVAGTQAGAVPYLIDTGHNGIAYKDNDCISMIEAVQFLIRHPEKRADMAEKALETINTLWNPEYAAKIFVEFSRCFSQGKLEAQEKGPLSIAKPLSMKKAYKIMNRAGRDKKHGTN